MKVTIKLMKYEPPSMPVEVETLDMDVDASIQIGDLRNQVGSQISYVPTVFLTTGGKEMKSTQTLADWQIGEGSTLYLLVEDKPVQTVGGKRNKKSKRSRNSRRNRNSRRKF